jgi:hypothetical protein
MSYHQQQAKDNIASQFGQSENFIKWLSEKMASYDNAQEWVNYVQENIDVYTASGYWLDVIGLIVGQSRTVPEAIPVQYFGFVGQTNIAGFGKARLKKDSDPRFSSSVLGDAEYRIVILGRIINNFANSTKVGVAESLSVLFNTNDINIQNFGTAAFRAYVGRDLTSTEIALITSLNLLPKAAGVRVDSVSYSAPSKTFGFKNSRFGFAGFGVGKFVGSF